ncbi:hypothetical protein LJC63_06000 [Ruminococcaceae bacterium OttesenSCG-928-L11]|nr:hypothetical protein [Ruminococcaceae bacterium OttesenSCG-928-L11]
MMKRRIVLLGFLLALILAACGSPSPPAAEPDLPSEIQILFFHDTACGSCDGTEEFWEVLREELAAESDLPPYRVTTYNVFELAGRQEYALALEAYGLSGENVEFPVMLLNGRLYSGMEHIRNNLREAFLTAAEDIFEYQYVYWLAPDDADGRLFDRWAVDADDSTVVYFYRITCEEYGQTKPLIDSLPRQVTVDGNTSDVAVIPFNTRSGSNGRKIAAFFEAYDVPPADQMVPIAFIRDRYFAGYEQIEAGLAEALQNGEATGFRFPLNP